MTESSVADDAWPTAREEEERAMQYEVTPDCSNQEFLAAARIYARDVVDAYNLTITVSNLEWEVSTRAKRRAGAVKYEDGTPTTVVLTWGQFDEQGWPAMASTIRHELIHVHLLNEDEDGSHGSEFETLAERLHTTTNCELFTEPEWWVKCQSCNTQLPRYRKSKLVTDTDSYRCGRCNGELTATRNT